MSKPVTDSFEQLKNDSVRLNETLSQLLDEAGSYKKAGDSLDLVADQLVEMAQSLSKTNVQIVAICKEISKLSPAEISSIRSDLEKQGKDSLEILQKAQASIGEISTDIGYCVDELGEIKTNIDSLHRTLSDTITSGTQTISTKIDSSYETVNLSVQMLSTKMDTGLGGVKERIDALNAMMNEHENSIADVKNHLSSQIIKSQTVMYIFGAATVILLIINLFI